MNTLNFILSPPQLQSQFNTLSGIILKLAGELFWNSTIPDVIAYIEAEQEDNMALKQAAW